MSRDYKTPAEHLTQAIQTTLILLTKAKLQVNTKGLVISTCKCDRDKVVPVKLENICKSLTGKQGGWLVKEHLETNRK